MSSNNTESSVMQKLLDKIAEALENKNLEDLQALSMIYQRMKSVS